MFKKILRSVRPGLAALLAAFVSLAMIFPASLSATATQVLVATIPTPGTNPVRIALSEDGRKLYVIEVDTPNRLLVINTSTNEVTSSTVLSSTQGSSGMVLSPSGSKIYILDGTGKDVDIVDLSSGTPTIGASISLSNSGAYRSIAVSPDGQRIYVSNGEAFVHSVTAIDTSTNTVSATIPPPTSGGDQLTVPEEIVVSPDNTIVYVSYYGNTLVARRGVASFTFDSSNNTYTERDEIVWTTGEKPSGLALSADGQKLYMSSATTPNSSLHVFNNPSAGFTDGSNPTPVSTGALNARYIALSADDSLLYLAHFSFGGGKLNVYSTADTSSVTTIVLPSAALFNLEPSSNEDSHFAYVGSLNDVYLIGEHLAPNWQTLSGATGTTLTSATLTASGISGTVTYSVSPALPAGFSLDTATGVITGSASSALSETTYTITGTNGSTSAVATVTLSVSADPGGGSGEEDELAATGPNSGLALGALALALATLVGAIAIRRRA